MARLIRAFSYMKKCRSCKQELDDSKFCLKSSSKDGLNSICKDCEILKHREYYINNKEEILKKSKERYRLGLVKKKLLSRKQKDDINNKRKMARRIDPRQDLLRDAKKRSKKKNLEFSITIDDIIITKVCPILGIMMEVNDGKFSDNSPTLDRVDNSKGYLPNNIMVISYLANKMKNSASKEQLIKFSRFMLEFYSEE